MTKNFSYLNQPRTWFFLAATILIVTIVLAAAEWNIRKDARVAHEKVAHAELVELEMLVEKVILEEVIRTQSMAATFGALPNMTQDDFAAYAHHAIHGDNTIAYFTATLGTVVNFVHPLAGHEHMVGFDYSQHNQYLPNYNEVYKKERMVIEGPVESENHGKVIIIRAPAITKHHYPDGESHKGVNPVIGVVSSVVPVSELLVALPQNFKRLEAIYVEIEKPSGPETVFTVGQHTIPPLEERVMMATTFLGQKWDISGTPSKSFALPMFEIWLIRLAAAVVALAMLVTFHVRSTYYRDKKNTLARFEESEGRFRQLFENATDPVFVIDAKDATIVDMSKRAAELLGYEEEEIIGKKVGDFAINEEESFGAVTSILKSGPGRIESYELLLEKKTGEIVPIEAHSQILEMPEGLMFYSFVRDITQQKKAQADLAFAVERAEAANLAKSTFLANMSHEVRTPLNGIMGLLHLVLVGDLPEKTRSYLETVKQCSESLLTILNDILDMSKLEAGRLELLYDDTEIGEQLNLVVRAFLGKAYEKSIALTTIVDEGLPDTFDCDSARFRQIVMNLVGNAMKFTQDGFVELHAKRIDVNGDPDWLQVKISDSGIGIDKEDIPTLFDRFTQVKDGLSDAREGTGLGLAICDELCKLLGGRIYAESENGIGSCFTVELPLKKNKKREAAVA